MYLMIWKKPNGEIYSKTIKYRWDNQKIGYINHYGHTLIYSLNLNDFMYKQASLRKRLLNRKILKLERKLAKIR